MSWLKRLSIFTLAFLLAGASHTEEKDPWEPFDLQTAELDGVTLHYDKSFSPKLDLFRVSFKDFLDAEREESRRVQGLLEKKNEVIAEVNRILGCSPSDEQRAQQDRILTTILRPKFRFSEVRGKIHLFLIRQDTVKDYLRKGGSLPSFSYDRASDTASYNFFASLSDPSPEKDIMLALPVRDVDSLETEAKDMFAKIADLGGMREGVAFHEIVEWTILNQRLRPHDPYFRWFSDGFSDAISARLLRKFVGEDAAKEFARDLQKYSGLEKELNLYYWMGPDFCIDTPLESEDRLENARYAYAALEAERLIQKHGMESVAKILDKACKDRLNDSRNLVAAVKDVTGEDIEHIFRRYQTFETREDGVKKYATAFNAAMERKDLSEALVNLLRIQELRGPTLQDYSNAAYLLFRLGNEEMGDQAIKKHMALLKNRGLDEAFFLMQKLFVEYSLKCRNLQKAHTIAEEILQAEPDFVPALAARAHRLLTSHQRADALAAARRILELEKNPDSPAYALAKAILSLEEKKEGH